MGGTGSHDAFGDVFVVLDDYDDLYAKDTLLGTASLVEQPRSRIRHLDVQCRRLIHGSGRACRECYGANSAAAGRSR